MIDSIDDSTYVRMLIDKEKGHGVRSAGLGRISANNDYLSDNIDYPWIRTRETASKLNECTESDDFLRQEMGYRVVFKESENCSYRDRNKNKKRVLNRYSSPMLQIKLKKTGAKFSEDEILRGVSIVTDCCDLRNTTVKNIPLLEEVGDNLTLDASSPLESLDSLKYARKVTVVAKNIDEMNAFLKKIGITDENGKPKIRIGYGINFVMKSYV